MQYIGFHFYEKLQTFYLDFFPDFFGDLKGKCAVGICLRMQHFWCQMTLCKNYPRVATVRGWQLSQGGNCPRVATVPGWQLS